MDIPLLVSPDSLTGLRDELAAASRTMGQIAAHAEQAARQGGWSGPAEQLFAAAARTTGARCDALARRLGADAARVDRLADELTHELAAIQRLEDALVDAVRDLGRRAAQDVTGDAAAAYEKVRHLLPDHLSPRWRTVASSIGDLL